MKEIRMNTDNNNCTLVGIHARRGDFAYPDKRDFGHEPADSSYINNAIEYFRRRYEQITNCKNKVNQFISGSPQKPTA